APSFLCWSLHNCGSQDQQFSTREDGWPNPHRLKKSRASGETNTAAGMPLATFAPEPSLPRPMTKDAKSLTKYRYPPSQCAELCGPRCFLLLTLLKASSPGKVRHIFPETANRVLTRFPPTPMAIQTIARDRVGRRPHRIQ